MPGRRAVLEEALVAERIHLWTDLYYAINDFADLTDGAIEGIIGRIRSTSHALGYVTNWRNIPPKMLRWYQLVDTQPRSHLVAQEIDWDGLPNEVYESILSPGREAWDHYGFGFTQHYVIDSGD